MIEAYPQNNDDSHRLLRARANTGFADLRAMRERINSLEADNEALRTACNNMRLRMANAAECLNVTGPLQSAVGHALRELEAGREGR